MSDEFTGTMPVPERLRFDEARLAEWMAEHLGVAG